MTNKQTDLENIIKEISYFESIQDYSKMFFLLKKGLSLDPFCYELYLQLGYYYLKRFQNANQAYLCFENAAFLCPDSSDLHIIHSLICQLKEHYIISVVPFSIVIVSYNSCNILKECIDSIRQNNPATSYEIVIVDNASTDGVTEWLKGEAKQSKDNFIIYLSQQNLGFGAGSNLGVSLANKENDIFFLNNDTIVTPNALFWLRMSLYQNNTIGAVGSYSNYPGNDQSIQVSFDSIREYIDWAPSNNQPLLSLGQERIWLSGFALLCRRKALDEVGLFDLDYKMGYFEDNDLSMRFLKKKYKLLACPNSFIYHYGSTSFKKNYDQTKKLLSENRVVFEQKWNGIDLNDYCFPALNIITKVNNLMNDKINNSIYYTNSLSILDIGCKAGVTLSKLKYIYPEAKLIGIETNQVLCSIANVYHTVYNISFEDVSSIIASHSIDFLISEVLFDIYPDDEQLYQIINNLKRVLSRNGYLICTANLFRTPQQLQAILYKSGFDMQLINMIYSQYNTKESIPSKYVFVAHLY